MTIDDGQAEMVAAAPVKCPRLVGVELQVSLAGEVTTVTEVPEVTDGTISCSTEDWCATNKRCSYTLIDQPACDDKPF